MSQGVCKAHKVCEVFLLDSNRLLFMNINFYAVCLRLLVSGFPILLFAQSSTLEIHREQKKTTSADLPETRFNRVMIIPFDHKMYMSQIDREIHEKTGKSAEEIVEIFRRGAANSVFIETRQVQSSKYTAISMHSEDPEIIADLDYIYKSIGYKYLPVPTPPDTGKPAATASLKKATDKAQSLFDGISGAKEEPGTRIKEGQLSSVSETREKYMHTEIVNNDALAYLSAKYECDVFVFVNQLDIVIPPGTDYRELSSDNYSRLIKTHYTIFNKGGAVLYGNAAKTWFSSRENDAQQIAAKYFVEIAKEIASHLP